MKTSISNGNELRVQGNVQNAKLPEINTESNGFRSVELIVFGNPNKRRMTTATSTIFWKRAFVNESVVSSFKVWPSQV